MNKEIAENGDGVAPARLERNVTEPIDERREFEKILLGAQVFNNEPSLSGWQLLAQDLLIDEAERNRLAQEIPDFRGQAINAIAYWVSLTCRLDALDRTRQLLAQLPTASHSNAKDLPDRTEMAKND